MDPVGVVDQGEGRSRRWGGGGRKPDLYIILHDIALGNPLLRPEGRIQGFSGVNRCPLMVMVSMVVVGIFLRDHCRNRLLAGKK